MNKKIIFWLDADLLSYCLAYYFQKKYEAELYAIIDITNRPKKFFQEQKLVQFKKIWFYHNFKNQKIISEPNYLKSFEKKNGIDIWQLAKNDRIFIHNYNSFYKFSEQEISIILEKDCKLFEEVLDQVKPDFFITTETALRPHHLFYLLCKKNGIKVLMLNAANWGNYCYISENYHRIDNFKELFMHKKSVPTTFNQLQSRLESNVLSKQHEKFFSSVRKSKIEKIKAALELFIHSDNSNEKMNYKYYGRKKWKVLFKEIDISIKRYFRKKYINRTFLRQIPNDSLFIFLPLQQEPERSLLISAPDYVNQVKTVEYISKCIPKNYLLFVKEHPTQGPPNRDWRKISDYKTMQNNTKVRLIDPAVPADKIIKKSKLVISVSGTISIESAFFNKSSITFVENDYSLIPSITRLKSKNELPELIKNSLEKKVDPNYVGKYFDILEENSFVFDLLGFQDSYSKHFYFDGNLVDVEISESQMKEFLINEKQKIENLVQEFKKKILVNIL